MSGFGRMAGRGFGAAMLAALVLAACGSRPARGPANITRDLSSSDFQEVSLDQLRRSPATFLGQRVQFDCYYAGTGKVYWPFYTRFKADFHVNFHVWQEGARLWKPTIHERTYNLLYVDRKKENLVRQVQNLGRYDTIRVRGMVVSAYDGKPWVQVNGIDELTGKQDFSQTALNHIAIGMRSAEKGDYNLAERRFRQALRLSLPSFARAEINRHLGIALFEMERHADAEEVLKQALQYRRDDPRMLLRLGQSVLELSVRHGIDAKRLRLAKQNLEEVIRLEPGDVRALSSLALTYGYLAADMAKNSASMREPMKLFRKAERTAQDALRLLPTYHPAMRNLGVIKRLQGRYDEAIGYYGQAVYAYPQERTYHKEWGLIYMRDKKMYDQAEERFSAYIDAFPNDKEFYVLRSEAREAQDKLDLALADAQAALNIDNDYRQAHLQAANVLRKLGRPAKAEPHIASYMQLGLDDPTGYLELARFYTAQEQWDKAIETCRKMLKDELFAKNEQAHYQLAYNLIHKPNPDYAEAAKVLERLLEINPNHSLGRYELAGVYFYNGRLKEAMRLVEPVAQEKGNIRARMRYGRILFEMGYDDDAKEQFRAVLDAQPDHDAAAYYLARLQVKEQPIEAIKTLWTTATGENAVPEYKALLGYAALKALKADTQTVKIGSEEIRLRPDWRKYIDEAAETAEMADKAFNLYYAVQADLMWDNFVEADAALRKAQQALEEFRASRPAFARRSEPLDRLESALHYANKRIERLYRDHNMERPE